MGLKAKDTGGGEPRELVPAGNYLGRVCGVYDIGTQAGGMYDPKHQIVVTWELHKRKGPARNGKGEVLTISKFYTLSFHEKATLRKDVEALLGQSFDDGTEFDVESLLGMSCRLQVVHTKKQNGDPRDAIGALMPLDDDDSVPKPELDDVYFEIRPDHAIPDNVPKWVRKKVEESVEYGGKSNGTTRAPVAAGVADDDIPY